MHPLRCCAGKEKGARDNRWHLGFFGSGKLVFFTIKVLIVRCFNLGNAGF